MSSNIKIHAVAAIVLFGCILIQTDLGTARQTIQPAGQAVRQVVPFDGPAIRVSHNTAILTWLPVDDSRVIGYEVWKGTTPDILKPTKVGNVTAYSVADLKQGETWFFRVSSYDQQGNRSALSDVVSKSIPKVHGR